MNIVQLSTSSNCSVQTDKKIELKQFCEIRASFTIKNVELSNKFEQFYRSSNFGIKMVPRNLTEFLTSKDIPVVLQSPVSPDVSRCDFSLFIKSVTTC